MHVHVHNHYPDGVTLAGAVSELAGAIGSHADAIDALAASVQALAASLQPSAQLVRAVAAVKAGAQLNDDLIPDVPGVAR